MQAFVSEHKVGIYFFRTTKVLNQKWGTLSPIKYEDPKYGIPVMAKAFGNFSYRIADPRSFFVNVVGGHTDYTISDFRTVMAERLTQSITDHIAESRLAYTDIDAHREELAAGMGPRLSADFGQLGFAVEDFRIEGINFDDDTIRRIGRIADMTAEAQAVKAVGLDYASVQKLEALREAARNEGGGAGVGMGLGAGIGMGQTIAQAMGQAGTPAAQSQSAGSDAAARLAQLKQMFDQQLITAEEFVAKKKQILDTI
jgi:membrane protease subunit (stomatin/prohibitin family)